MAEKCVLCGFGRKTCFYRFGGKTRITVLAGGFDMKMHFCGFCEKTHFGRKRVLWFWRENTFWWENVIFGFGGKTYFSVLAGKRVFRFRRKNEVFGFGGKRVSQFWRETRFYGFGEKTCFAGKMPFWFWRKNTFLRI